MDSKIKVNINNQEVGKEKAELIEMIKSGEIFSILRDHFHNIELYDKEEYLSAFIYKDWFDCKFACYGNYLLTLQNIHPSVGHIRDGVLDSLSITEYIKFSLFDMDTQKVLKAESWNDVWTILNDAREKGEV